MNRIYPKTQYVLLLLVLCTVLPTGFFIMYSVIHNQYKSELREITSNQSSPLSGMIRSPQGVDILVRIADTEKTRELGLSHFKSLPRDQGMLFVFPQIGMYGFWMKDMQFPLDIIWINDSFTIIDRVINTDPSSYPKTFTPKASARYVLEIPSGMADHYGLIIGSSVIIQK